MAKYAKTNRKMKKWRTSTYIYDYILKYQKEKGIDTIKLREGELKNLTYMVGDAVML